MASMHPYKIFNRQQVLKPLQYLAHNQGWPVGKKYPAVVAAAFNTYNI
jgi:hypothetical protein